MVFFWASRDQGERPGTIVGGEEFRLFNRMTTTDLEGIYRSRRSERRLLLVLEAVLVSRTGQKAIDLLQLVRRDLTRRRLTVVAIAGLAAAFAAGLAHAMGEATWPVLASCVKAITIAIGG